MLSIRGVECRRSEQELAGFGESEDCVPVGENMIQIISFCRPSEYVHVEGNDNNLQSLRARSSAKIPSISQIQPRAKLPPPAKPKTKRKKNITQ